MTHEYSIDEVDQAFARLREVAIPDGPGQQLLDQTRIQLSDLEPSSSGTRGWIVAAASVLLVAFTSWSVLLGYGASIAFADVQRQLQKIRTVRYVSTRLVENVGDEPQAPPGIEDKAAKINPKRLQHVGSDAHQPRVIKVMGRYLQRTETLSSEGAVSIVQIDDFKSGKHVTLDLDAKECTEYTTQVTMNFDGKEKNEVKIQAAPEVDLFAQISEIPPEATVRLSDRTIAGVKAIGFFSQKSKKTLMGMQTWEQTYWVDPETKLPIRIEISHYSTDKRIGRSDWVSSGFVFDAPMEAEQFSTGVPNGFKHKTSKIIGIKVD